MTSLMPSYVRYECGHHGLIYRDLEIEGRGYCEDCKKFQPISYFNRKATHEQYSSVMAEYGGIHVTITDGISNRILEDYTIEFERYPDSILFPRRNKK